MSERLVVVHPTPADVAESAAARLLLLLHEVQSVRPTAHVVLTGGGLGTASLAAAARSPLRSAVDWTGVHLWWGDERFLPAGDAERNETQARAALIDHIDIPAPNVHPMPPSDAAGITSPKDAARAYADELAAHADGAGIPEFDVVLLGVGPDRHIASLFPEHPALDVTDEPVTGVHGSPKPPPERVTLTLPTIQSARQVWALVAGAEKAPAVAAALGGADVRSTPAAAAVGRQRTLWLIDTAAAGGLDR